MATKNHAAIVRIAGENAHNLFESELLWRPLGAILAETLAKAGIEKLLIACAAAAPAALREVIPNTVVVPLGDGESCLRFLQGVRAAIVFTGPALIDADAIGELFSCAAHLGPTVFAAGGRPVAHALSGRDLDDPAQLLIRASLGSAEGFRVLENHTGICMPITNFADLSDADSLYRREVNTRLMESGVHIAGVDTCYIAADAQIAPGVQILPGTIIRGGCSVGAGTRIGPYADLQENCRVGENCRIGSFVALKNAVVQDGAEVLR